MRYAAPRILPKIETSRAILLDRIVQAPATTRFVGRPPPVFILLAACHRMCFRPACRIGRVDTSQWACLCIGSSILELALVAGTAALDGPAATRKVFRELHHNILVVCTATLSFDGALVLSWDGEGERGRQG